MGGGWKVSLSEPPEPPLDPPLHSLCTSVVCQATCLFQCQINNLTAVLLLFVNSEQKRRRLDCAV